MDISSLFEEMIDFISFFLYKRKKAASTHHNFAHEINKEVWLRGKISFRGSTPRGSSKHSEVLQRLRERTVNPSSNDIAGSSPAFRTKQQPYGITAVQQVLALLAKVRLLLGQQHGVCGRVVRRKFVALVYAGSKPVKLPKDGRLI